MNIMIITKKMQLIKKYGFLQNRFESQIAAQQPCRQRGRLDFEKRDDFMLFRFC